MTTLPASTLVRALFKIKSNAPSKVRPVSVESLEDRSVPAAQPLATLSIPDHEPFIGEQVQFTVSFDNASPTDVGFGPYVDLILPARGIDGAGAAIDDGISFVSASYLGAPVVATVLTFNASGQATHPYAVDTAGTPLVVNGQPGDQLVVLQLPFGSFTNDQPVAPILVTANVSNLADVDQALPISVRGGFQYGNDALANPATDPSIVQASANSDTITPKLWKLRKEYVGPEDETATGPNYVRDYRVIVDIANNQTITNLDLSDVLPSNMQFVGNVQTFVGGSLTGSTAINTPSTSTPGGTLTRRLASVTGSTSDNDAELRFSYYIPRIDAGSAEVINSATGDDVLANNNASATGNWNPIDPRDGSALALTLDPVGIEHVLTPKSIAVQKSVAVVGGGSVKPGEVLEYTIELQVSDYFAFDNLSLTDLISDGQLFDASFTPTFSVNEHGVSNSANFGAGNFNVFTDTPTPGEDTITFDLSGQLSSMALNSQLVGGGIPDGGTGGPPPSSAPPLPFGATTAQVKFRTIIQENYYADFPSGDPSIDEGDRLTNTVDVAGDLVSVVDATSLLGTSETDGSGTEVQIVRGSLSKSIYAINGVNGAYANGVQVSPGDTITYRLTYSLPTSDVEQFRLEDFLPLPIFSSGELVNFSAVSSALAPVAGQVKYGPSDTFHTLPGSPTPTLSTNTVANSFTLDYGNYDNSVSPASTIDILFTVTVSAQPFADKLFLTNQVRAIEQNTAIEAQPTDAIIQIQLTEPVLSINKGVVATNNASGSFSQTVGPVSFTAPGSAGPRFSGTINSNGLSATPISADLTNVDAGDLVTFALTVENIGSGLNGAFDVTLRDVLPTGFSIPVSGAGLNFSVTDGSGATINFAKPDGSAATGADLFTAQGIRLLDPGATVTPLGALDEFHPTNGRNIAIITFDLVADSNVTPRQVASNTLVLTNYAGIEGGPDHTPTDPSVAAFAQIAPPTVTKQLVSTSIVNAGNANNQVVIGELATYRVTVTIPEGETPNLTIRDSLPTGLAYVDLVSATNDSSNISFTGSLTPVITNSGRQIEFQLGNLTNSDRDNSVADTFTFEYRVVTLNVATNTTGRTLTNSVVPLWSGNTGTTVSSPNITVIQPVLTTTKSAVVDGSGTVGDAGDPIVYTINVTNNSSVDAFDATLSDALPTLAVGASMIVAPSITSFTDSLGLLTSNDFELVGTDGTGWTLRSKSGVDFDMPRLSGRFISIQVSGTISGGVLPGQSIANTAFVPFTSLDGNPGTISAFNTNSTERTGAGGVNSYVSSGTANISINVPGPVKSIVASSEASTGVVAGTETASIGEIIRYRLQVAIPESTMPSLVIRDLLPLGMTLIDPAQVKASFTTDSAITASADLTGIDNDAVPPTFVLPSARITTSLVSGQEQVEFNFGDITNNDNDVNVETLTIEFNAHVQNAAVNQSGVAKTNNFTTRVNGAQVGPASNNVTVNLVEPVITNLLKVVTPTSGDEGDVVNYTITFSNTGNATAFDVQVTDLLPSGLALDIPSMNIVSSGATGIANNSFGNAIEVVIDSLAVGGSVTITYSATLSGSAAAASLTNDANITYTSLPGPATEINPTGSTIPGGSGDPLGERNGGGGVNDYLDASNVTITTGNPAIDKVPVSPASYIIGEEVTFDVLVTLPEGTTRDAIVFDDLPAGFAFVAGSANIITAQADSPLLTADFNGVLPVPTFTSTGADGEVISWDFGDLTAPGDNLSTNNSFVIRFRAQVLDTPTNRTGTTVTNVATLQFTDPDTGNPTTISDPNNPNVVVLAPAQVSGRVFIDNDNDGIDDGEPNIDNVTVKLVGIDDLGQIVDRTLQTGPNGQYLFDLVRPGSYRVEETQPAGFLDGRDTADNLTSLPGSGSEDAVPGLTLLAGQLDADNNFGELRPAAVSGTVHIDTNNNGIYEPGTDVPIENISITLAGTDDLGNPVNLSTTTNASGFYEFTNLRPGTYTITETQPAGLLDGTDTQDNVTGIAGTHLTDVLGTITLNENDVDADNNFGELRPARITGTVHVDVNDNGVFDGGDPVLQGVVINLTGTDDHGNIVNLTTTTDILGEYAFDNLRPGTYDITEVQPAGYFDGRDTYDNIDSIPGSELSDIIPSITLTEADVDDQNNFGELPPASISGRVYVDANNDGLYQTGENAIQNVSIRLQGTDGFGKAVDLTTTTNSQGQYTFGNLLPGTYTITETQPNGFLDGRETLDNAVSLPGSAQTDSIGTINLAVGQNDGDNNFGELRPATLSGFVYVDANNNGVLATGSETPLSNVLITLTGTNDLGIAVNLTTNTSENGFYQFSNLRPGTYTITETQPANFLDGLETLDNVSPIGGSTTTDSLTIANVTEGTNDGNNNFGELRPARLSGFVYIDADNDGILDGGVRGGSSETPIANVTIQLFGTDDRGNPVTRSTQTDSQGFYEFLNLRPGTYRIVETQPTGYLDGTDTFDNVTGNNNSHVSDELANITLVEGQHDPQNNFGELRPAAITGRVYFDINNNGISEVGEPAIPNVTLTLTGTDDHGNAVTRTTTTSNTGDYSFGDLRPGTYTVTQTQPANYLDGADTSNNTSSLPGSNNTDSIGTLTLVEGQVDPDNNFGEFQPARIAGAVFDDRNNNGVMESSEARIPGITITLTGTDDQGTPVSLTTITDVNGEFAFTGLRPGTYTVTETQPPHYFDGRDVVGSAGGTLGNDVISVINLPAGADAPGYLFGEVSPSSIAGSVYLDLNDNGVREPGEPGLPTTLTLTGTDDLGNTITRTTQSNDLGNYVFNSLRPGTYTITETQPGLVNDGTDAVGSAGGTLGNDVLANITLPPNTLATDYNFGETTSSISGSVFVDGNRSGARESTDFPIPGVTILLSGTDVNGNQITRTTTTDANGKYLFEFLPAGTYTVSEVQPTNYVDGTDYVGSDGGQVGNDILQTIQLGRNDFAVNYNFSEAGLIANLVSKRALLASAFANRNLATQQVGAQSAEAVDSPMPSWWNDPQLLASKVRSANPVVDPVNDQSMVGILIPAEQPVMATTPTIQSSISESSDTEPSAGSTEAETKTGEDDHLDTRDSLSSPAIESIVAEGASESQESQSANEAPSEEGARVSQQAPRSGILAWLFGSRQRG